MTGTVIVGVGQPKALQNLALNRVLAQEKVADLAPEEVTFRQEKVADLAPEEVTFQQEKVADLAPEEVAFQQEK
ncbi:hypothetical protein GOP47_0025011, partial [Adiantum capillus-veneris]